MKIEEIKMQPVTSRCIEAAAYSAADRILRIRFTGGATYDYLSVPAATLAEFQAAASKGQFVNYVVKPKFPYRRVS